MKPHPTSRPVLVLAAGLVTVAACDGTTALEPQAPVLANLFYGHYADPWSEPHTVTEPGKEQNAAELEAHDLPSPYRRVRALYRDARLADGTPAELQIISQTAQLTARTRRGTTTGARLAGTVIAAHAVDAQGGQAPVTLKIEWVWPAPPGYDDHEHAELYGVSQLRDGNWTPLCIHARGGDPRAIPIASVWNQLGDRSESASEFTFACVSGVIAKCNGFGYKPWARDVSTAAGTVRLTGDLHDSCTRAMMADLCGNGQSYTLTGTPINIFDNKFRTPVKKDDVNLREWAFEAGYDRNGAHCLAKFRWEHLKLTGGCPAQPEDGRARGPVDRSDPAQPVDRSCNSLEESKVEYPDVHLFVESARNVAKHGQ